MTRSAEEDENEVISTNKRRKVHELTQEETDESSGNSDYSDASIEVVGQREASVGDDDEDLDLLQALDETRDETERPPLLAMGGNNHDRGEAEASTEMTTREETQFTEVEGEAGPRLQAMAEHIYDEPIHLEAEAIEQQVVEIPPEEAEDPQENSTTPVIHKAVRDYRCPICFEPPETAVMTPCGHIFCVACLFQMVNSSRGYRKNGHCALCRSDVKFRDIKMVVLRKKRVSKQS